MAEAKQFDIAFLQETHCHLKKDENMWSKEWSRSIKDSYWSRGTSRSKGVAVLFNTNFLSDHMSVSDVVIDANGRSIKLILNTDNTKYSLLNVYAPNNECERVKFFLEMQHLLNDSIEVENIVGGDYNCTMQSEKDRYNCSGKNDIGQVDLHYMLNAYNLEDIWRIRNPEKKEYTWEGRGKKSRIDFWLTSTSLNNQIENTFHTFAPYTDHSAICLTLRTQETVRGRGVWKMNTSHLFNNRYKVELSQLWTHWRDKRHEYKDVRTWWDVGKRHIKNMTIRFSKESKTDDQCKLDELEGKLNDKKFNEGDIDEINRLQFQYESIHSKKTEGAKIRSRIQWWEEGERSTKFFHNLEKRNGKNKLWDKILDKDGNTLCGLENIQKTQVEFYKELYHTQNLQNDDGYFLEHVNASLSESSKAHLDSIITKEEILKALKKMSNNKSPGEDGIPVEFYKLNWNMISDDLLEVYRTGLDDKQLSYTQYLAIIILLYKKGSREDIKNWRPISLLNVDYKILSKVLAERLKSVLPEIINGDQRGCVPGRFIGENIRLIDDLIFEVENSTENPIILMLDQEKAFDRVEWNWLFSTLEKYNFGSTFIGWLQALYKDAKSSILTNGVQSEYFEISRGIRQGDALSALLYIIQFEPLAQKLRASNLIEGISLNLKNCGNQSIEVKECQYVDDSNSMLKNKENIDNFLEVMDKFERVSGSKINLHKTVGLIVRENMEEVFHELRLTTGPEKVLGIPLGKTNDNDKEFWESLISKMKTKLDIWSSRDLSLEGKTYVIQSLAVSQLLYSIEMKNIDNRYIDSINQFIWDFFYGAIRGVQSIDNFVHYPEIWEVLVLQT